ncbi:MAG: hypothetical protein ACTSPK_00055 [Candidatus Heimdallarchaeota archaeon]
MNKICPICKKKVTRKDKHTFIKGQRYHRDCVNAKIQYNMDRMAFLGDGSRFMTKEDMKKGGFTEGSKKNE